MHSFALRWYQQYMYVGISNCPCRQIMLIFTLYQLTVLFTCECQQLSYVHVHECYYKSRCYNAYNMMLCTFLLQTDAGTLKELFPTGKQLEPTVTRLNDDRLALGRDEMTIFIDSEGNPTQKYALTWTDIPSVMGQLESFIVLHCIYVCRLYKGLIQSDYVVHNTVKAEILLRIFN